MDTKKATTGWSDNELEASVEAYLKMWTLEKSGQTFKKSDENRLLREGPLHQRSVSSIEYRMQNISAVFEQLGLQRITGYMPAKNIGAGVSERIRKVLAAKLDLPAQIATSTVVKPSPAERPAAPKPAIQIEPNGILNPRQLFTISISFARALHVRKQVQQLAGGICEGCDKPAPFVGEDGRPFLEVHHVKHLAQKGSDRITNAVALCPNCHQRCHRSSDREAFTEGLYAKIGRLARE
ncbi:HNH endonuclease signature motif containing protein [Pseudomonas sp. FP2309]|uniref:HNH endonuclease n=1 Tax=Pseudomonas sp. FP2309 TaxID=2954091 RepID=UPI002732FC1A|nr:HNH endonuclease signature motif containing protein [Pseudomonas sp. FP2309]WLH67351.1 HNH endonuclease signature motif containing protein [Pseudomonas sp. FP2309]